MSKVLDEEIELEEGDVLTELSKGASDNQKGSAKHTMSNVEALAGEMTDFEAYVDSLPMNKDGTYQKPRNPSTDEIATFVVCGSGGYGQWITLSPTLYALRTPPQGGAPKELPIAGSAMIMKFKESMYQTSNPNEWLMALDPEMGYGTTYTFNQADPTGFWRKCGFAKIQPQVEREVTAVMSPEMVARLAMGALQKPSNSTVIVSGPRSMTRPEFSQ